MAGGIHHVLSRGNRKATIFRDSTDYRRFAHSIDLVAQRHDWQWLSYCLMPNHIHLVLETPRRTLGAGMRVLLGDYARRFNDRYDLVGHVYQGRFKSFVVTTDAYFAQLIRYVAFNPVEKKLVEHPAEWPWSSCGRLLSRAADSQSAGARVDDLLAVWGGEPGRRYERLIATEPGPGDPLARALLEAPRPELAELLDEAGSATSIAAAHEAGYSQEAIAQALGIHQTTVSRRLRMNGV